MSELKELSWEVQETVQPLPFEELERRGLRRRRHRRLTLAGVGAIGVATVAVVAALLPFGDPTGSEQPPVTGPTTPIVVDKAAESLVRGPARLQEVIFASPTSWVATWDGSTYPKMRYTAVLSRNGVRTTTPVRDMWYSALRIGDDPVAVVGPKGDGDQKDPSWAQALMVRLTAQGKVEKKLRWAAPTTTFGPNEVLTYEVIHDHVPLILNPDDGTLRELEIPGKNFLSAPVQDSTGRWWLMGDKQNKQGQIFWTDDGGRNWNRSAADPDEGIGGIGVSDNGNTAIAFGIGDSENVTLKQSTDHGKTWTTGARERTWTRPPVALNDGSVVLLDKQKIVRLDGGQLATAPKNSVELRGGDSLLYTTIQNRDGLTTGIATSTDLGKTWKTFMPR